MHQHCLSCGLTHGHNVHLSCAQGSLEDLRHSALKSALAVLHEEAVGGGVTRLAYEERLRSETGKLFAVSCSCRAIWLLAEWPPWNARCGKRLRSEMCKRSAVRVLLPGFIISFHSPARQ